MNTQAPEKRVRFSDVVDLHSVFHTIQGEGPFCGTPAVFVRLAGCNLQCPGCDTDYTSTRELIEPIKLTHKIRDLFRNTQYDSLRGRKLVVVTGGEPFRQDLTLLLNLLQLEGYFVQIETNGSFAPSPGVFYNLDIRERDGVYVVCSPKTGKINTKLKDVACCLKYVMRFDQVNPIDGLPNVALGHSAKPLLYRPFIWDRPIYLQPMDDGEGQTVANQKSLAACIESCMRYGYTLQLQTHKLMGMP